MKKLLWVFALALGSTACQHQAPPTQAAAAVPRAPVQTVMTRPPAPVAMVDSLTPEMRDMLRQTNLAALYLVPEPGKTADYQSVLDGFFGNQPQRLSLALLKVAQDSLRPGLFHVIGKTRYKQLIRSFAGEMQLIKLVDYHNQGALLTQNDDSFVQDTTSNGFPRGEILNARAYSAIASFHFTSPSPPAYILDGYAMLDFWLTDAGKMGLLYAPCEGCIDDKAPAKGSGLLLRGNWFDAANNATKPFIVSRDAFFISPSIIQDFGIGDRGAQVNPKYAKLGWDTYWENDEWWADSPKPKLNL